MKKTKKLVKKIYAAPEEKFSISKAVITSGVVFGLLGILLSGGVKAQSSDLSARDTSKVIPAITSKPEVTPRGVFFMDPTYSPTDKVATVRLQGGSSIHGIKAGGFLDLSGKEMKDGMSTTFGKFTLSKSADSTSKIAGTGVAVEFTLSGDAPDKVRTGLLHGHKLADGTVVFRVYPFSEKGFEPFVMLSVDQKLGKKLMASAFLSSDIKSKCYYGEAEITGKITKQISALLQTRVGGTYDSKPKAGVYIGARIKF